MNTPILLWWFYSDIPIQQISVVLKT